MNSQGQDDGKCGVRNYPNLTEDKINLMLSELRNHGMQVTGTNPWDVDTKSYGVKLRGTWNRATKMLSLIVTAKDWYVPCNKIWEKIDPLIPHIAEISADEVAALTRTAKPRRSQREPKKSPRTGSRPSRGRSSKRRSGS